MSQNQLAELFETSKQNISEHILNIFKDKELNKKSVIKDYLKTAQDGKIYKVKFYSLDMILTIGFVLEVKEGCNLGNGQTIIFNNIWYRLYHG